VRFLVEDVRDHDSVNVESIHDPPMVTRVDEA